MENDIACEDYYNGADVNEFEETQEYSVEDMFTFSGNYDPIYEKYQQPE